MRLADKLMQTRGPVEIWTPVGLMRLPGAERFAMDVAALPARYALMDDVARACGDMILLQPDLLSSCSDLLRVPARTLWIEWWNHQMAALGPDGAPVRPQRTGLLVEAAEDGRSGTIRAFHENEAGSVDCASAAMCFDLDAPPVAAPAGDALYSDLLAHAWLEVDAEWMRCYRLSAGADFGSYGTAMQQLWSNGCKDALILFAFCLLLSARAGLDFTPSNLDKLNRARAKRGKAPLLDHIEVSARIFGRGSSEERRAAAHARTAARLHHVRGHWVRRHDALFWRRSHLRGSAALGAAPVRTTRLFLGERPATRH